MFQRNAGVIERRIRRRFPNDVQNNIFVISDWWRDRVRASRSPAIDFTSPIFAGPSSI